MLTIQLRLALVQYFVCLIYQLEAGFGSKKDNLQIIHQCAKSVDIKSEEKTSSQIDHAGNIKEIFSNTITIEHLSNGETACFQLIQNDKIFKSYAIKFSEDVAGKDTITDGYEFGIPNATAKCTCSCSDNNKIISTCNPTESKFCENFDKCVIVNKAEAENNKGCTKLLANPTVCCTVGFNQADLERAGRYKAFQLQKSTANVQYISNIEIYGLSYDGKSWLEKRLNNLDVILNAEEIPVPGETIFRNVKAECKSEDFPTPHSSNNEGWLIGKSEPFENRVYETSQAINGKDEYDIGKIGWVRYDSNIGKYKFGDDGNLDKKIKSKFTYDITNCAESKISARFESIKVDDFKNRLKTLEYVNMKNVTWVPTEKDHATVQWVYRSGAIEITRLTLKFHGTGFEVKPITNEAKLGKIKAKVVITEDGDRYIEVNMINSFGRIFFKYTDSSKDKIKFSIQCINRKSFTKYAKFNDLDCQVANTRTLCYKIDEKSAWQDCIDYLPCDVTKIPDSEVTDNTIITERLISDDPLSWKTWAKYMNPMEWFKDGVDSWQEAVMLIIEVVGLLAGIGVVLKILRMFGLLGKCCRIFWCCCLCPKVEKKFKRKASHTRKRIETMYEDTRRRVTGNGIYTSRKRYRRESVGLSASRDQLLRTSAFSDLKSRFRTNTAGIAAILGIKERSGGPRRIGDLNDNIGITKEHDFNDCISKEPECDVEPKSKSKAKRQVSFKDESCHVRND